MNNMTARNLYEFGDYFKKSLVLSVIAVIFTPIMAVLLFVLPGFALFLGVILIFIAIAVLVFQILMIIRLYRAKESSPHPEIIKAFQLILAAIIVSAVSIAAVYIWWGLDVMCDFAAIILELLAWQSLGKYIKVYSSEADPNEGFPMISEGIKTYITFTYVSLVFPVVNFILGFFYNDPYSWNMMDTISIIISLVSLIISIVIIVAQFKIANGFIQVFASASSVSPGTQYSTPPASTQQYGIPQSSFKQEAPSSEKVRYCSKCGTKIIGDAKFCTSCGETLE
jgi:hypothetical protein